MHSQKRGVAKQQRKSQQKSYKPTKPLIASLTTSLSTTSPGLPNGIFTQGGRFFATTSKKTKSTTPEPIAKAGKSTTTTTKKSSKSTPPPVEPVTPVKVTKSTKKVVEPTITLPPTKTTKSTTKTTKSTTKVSKKIPAPIIEELPQPENTVKKGNKAKQIAIPVVPVSKKAPKTAAFDSTTTTATTKKLTQAEIKAAAKIAKIAAEGLIKAAAVTKRGDKKVTEKAMAPTKVTEKVKKVTKKKSSSSLEESDEDEFTHPVIRPTFFKIPTDQEVGNTAHQFVRILKRMQRDFEACHKEDNDDDDQVLNFDGPVEEVQAIPTPEEDQSQDKVAAEQRVIKKAQEDADEATKKTQEDTDKAAKKAKEDAKKLEKKAKEDAKKLEKEAKKEAEKLQLQLKKEKEKLAKAEKAAKKLEKVRAEMTKIDPKLETKTAVALEEDEPIQAKKVTKGKKIIKEKITKIGEEKEQQPVEVVKEDVIEAPILPKTTTKPTKPLKSIENNEPIKTTKQSKTSTAAITTSEQSITSPQSDTISTTTTPTQSPTPTSEEELDSIMAPFITQSKNCRPTHWGTKTLTFDQLIQRFSPIVRPSSIDSPAQPNQNNITQLTINSAEDLTPVEIQAFEPFLRRLAEVQSYHEWEAIEGLKRHVRMRFVAHLRSTFLDPTELAKRTHEVDNLELELYMNKLTGEGILKSISTPTPTEGAHNSDGHGHFVAQNNNSPNNGNNHGDEHFAIGSSTVPIATPHQNPGTLGLGEDSKDMSTDDTNRRFHLRRGSSRINLPTSQISSHTSLPQRLLRLIPPQLLVATKDPVLAKSNHIKQMHILRANYVSLHDMKYKEEVIYAALEDLNLIPPGYVYEPIKKNKLVIEKVPADQENDNSTQSTHPKQDNNTNDNNNDDNKNITPTTEQQFTYSFPHPTSQKQQKKTTSQKELFQSTTPSTGNTDSLLSTLLTTLNDCGFFTQESGRFDLPLRDYSNLRTPYNIANWELAAVPVLNYKRSPASDDAISPNIRLFDHYLANITWDKLAVLQRLMLQDYRIELVRRFDHTVAQHQLVRFFLLSESYLQPRFFPALKRLISDCYVHNLIDLKYTPRAHLDASFIERITSTQSTRPKVLQSLQSKLYTSIADYTNDINPDGVDLTPPQQHLQYQQGSNNINNNNNNVDNTTRPIVTSDKLQKGTLPHTIIPTSSVDTTTNNFNKAHLTYLINNRDENNNGDNNNNNVVVKKSTKKTKISTDMGLPTDPLGIYQLGTVKPLPRKEFLSHLSQMEQKRYKNDTMYAFSQFYHQLLSSQVILDNAPPGSGHSGFTWVLKHLLDYEIISRQRWNPQQQQQTQANGDNVTMRDLSLNLGVTFTSLPTEADIIDVETVNTDHNNVNKKKDVIHDHEDDHSTSLHSDFAPSVHRKLRKLTPSSFSSTTTTNTTSLNNDNYHNDQDNNEQMIKMTKFTPSPQPHDNNFNPNNTYPLPLTIDPMNPTHTKEALIVEGLQRMGVIGFNAGRYCYDIFLPLSTTPLNTQHIITPNQMRIGRSLLNHQEKQPQTEEAQPQTTMTIAEALAHKQPKPPSKKSQQPITSPVERIFSALVQSGIFNVQPPNIQLPIGGDIMDEKH